MKEFYNFSGITPACNKYKKDAEYVLVTTRRTPIHCTAQQFFSSKYKKQDAILGLQKIVNQGHSPKASV